ncbi:hypothetical protein ACFFRR_009497 [Megaselia abdita]
MFRYPVVTRSRSEERGNSRATSENSNDASTARSIPQPLLPTIPSYSSQAIARNQEIHQTVETSRIEEIGSGSKLRSIASTSADFQLNLSEQFLSQIIPSTSRTEPADSNTQNSEGLRKVMPSCQSMQQRTQNVSLPESPSTHTGVLTYQSQQSMAPMNHSNVSTTQYYHGQLFSLPTNARTNAFNNMPTVSPHNPVTSYTQIAPGIENPPILTSSMYQCSCTLPTHNPPSNCHYYTNNQSQYSSSHIQTQLNQTMQQPSCSSSSTLHHHVMPNANAVNEINHQQTQLNYNTSQYLSPHQHSSCTPHMHQPPNSKLLTSSASNMRMSGIFQNTPINSFSQPHVTNNVINSPLHQWYSSFSNLNQQMQNANQDPFVKQRALYNLPEFDGTPEKWPIFIAHFVEYTNEYRYSNLQNVMRLTKS